MEDEHSAARAFADGFWEDLLELEPVLGTMIGDERFDDRLPDPGPEGRDQRGEIHRRALEAAGGFDRSRLDEDGRTSLGLVEAICRRQLAALEHRLDRFHAVSHLFGPSQLLADLGSMQRADTPERLERYLTRLSKVPAYLTEIGKTAEEGAAAGQTVPALVIERTIAQTGRLVSMDPKSSPGMAPVPEGDAAGRDRVAEVLRTEVWPAYDAYLDVLRAYRPRARDTIGISAVPNGDAMYEAEILAHTTLALDPGEVHRLGVEDLERIQRERGEIARAAGFPDARAALEEHSAGGRNVARSRQEMVDLAREQVERSWEAAPAAFGRLPKANCEVRPVEEFRERDMPGAFYQPPTADNSRPGIYYINCSDLEERQLHPVAAVTFHEANPGHHFQMSMEQEYAERPPLRRFGGPLAGSAFTEGWGLYSERLADELGLYRDEFERLGMLEAQGWRACRLIVDTGIHAFRWDRQRAVDQMVEGGVGRLNAQIEVDRYIAVPGQALAYKIGQFQIEKWRAEAAAREGGDFSLRSFHDRLLSLGSLPLPALQSEMDRGSAP